MATTSDFSVGLLNKLFLALAEAGWAPSEVNDLAQDVPSLRAIRDVRLGVAEITVTKRLCWVEAVDLPANATSFQASDHFKTKDGLYVWSGFENLVLSAVGVAETTPAAKIASFDLLKDTPDERIRAELPDSHVFQDANVFCSHLAGMLDHQAGGKGGPLLTNGGANIFYVKVADEVVAVYACWPCDSREWSVRAAHLGGDPWGVGNRVFSAAAVA
ncbi:MAG: hypothetical protein ABIH36_02710 [bacterium]